MRQQSGSLGWIVAGILGLALISQCSTSDDEASGGWDTSSATESEGMRETKYVDASAANCRARSSTDSAMRARLSRGERVTVTESQAGWRLVDRASDDCWVSGELLSTAPPARDPPPIVTAYEQPAPAPRTTSVYYRNCSAARAAGAAPVYRGDPGYAPHLDRDRDGVGCE